MMRNDLKTFNDVKNLFKNEPYVLEVIFKDIDLELETEFSRGMKAKLFAIELEDHNCVKCYFQTDQYIMHNSSFIKDEFENEDFYQPLIDGETITLFFDKDDLLSNYFLKFSSVEI